MVESYSNLFVVIMLLCLRFINSEVLKLLHVFTKLLLQIKKTNVRYFIRL